VTGGPVNETKTKKAALFARPLNSYLLQKQKSRGAPSGFPTALISQLMFLWQQADPSYEVSPPPAVFRKDRAEHYAFSKLKLYTKLSAACQRKDGSQEAMKSGRSESMKDFFSLNSRASST
jgi:hypothetical protein